MEHSAADLIKQRYDELTRKVAAIALAAGRKEPPIIIAVSKKHPLATVAAAIESGIFLFGENRIQELIEKFGILKERGARFELHHIGPLQTGTLKKLLGLCQATHGAGSVHAIRELMKQSAKAHIGIKYFIQANLTGEDTKTGMSRDELILVLQHLANYKNEFCLPYGLMTMGPTSQDIDLTRKVFRELRKIRDTYFPEGKLSMGMSGDYPVAIEEGSDFLRIGTAIFGERT